MFVLLALFEWGDVSNTYMQHVYGLYRFLENVEICSIKKEINSNLFSQFF